MEYCSAKCRKANKSIATKMQASDKLSITLTILLKQISQEFYSKSQASEHNEVLPLLSAPALLR